MKYLLISLFFVPLVSSAETIDLRRHVESSGNASLKVTADLASWHITIRGEAPALADAGKSLEEAVARLVGDLGEAGLTADSLRLSDIASGKDYEGEDAAKKFKGYYAERTAAIQLDKLARRAVLENILLRDDRIHIRNVDLRSSSHEENRKQSLVMAASAAKAKAEFLAGELGATLGPVLSISEGSDNEWVYRNNISAVSNVPSGDYQTLEYKATVTVKFELK